MEVIPSYFVEQIVAGATDHGGNCGGGSVVRRGADRGIVPQIVEEIVNFLREVPQVQFVGCGVPVITQRRFDSEGATNSVRRQSLWAFSWSAEGGYSFQLGGLAAVAGVFFGVSRRFSRSFRSSEVERHG